MDCECNKKSAHEPSPEEATIEQELVEVAKRTVKSESDPFTGVIKFLAERPEGSSLPGRLVLSVLQKTFGGEEIPGLIKIISGHVREISRRANSIEISKEHPTSEQWGEFVIKQKDKIKFEIGADKGRLTLNNIQGLVGVEHGVELPLEKILVNAPNLIVTVKLGLLHPQKTVSI